MYKNSLKFAEKEPIATTASHHQQQKQPATSILHQVVSSSHSNTDTSQSRQHVRLFTLVPLFLLLKS